MKFFKQNFNRIFLLLLSILTVVVRYSRLEVFKIYTDSYKFLLIANATFNGKWISAYYPTFVQFQGVGVLDGYKWLFGILVGICARGLNLLGFAYSPELIERVALAGVILSSVAGLLLLFKIFKKLELGQGVSRILLVLFACSGVSIIWSGFIITDTFASAVILLFIYLLQQKTNWKTLLGLAVMSFVMYFTRQELLIAAGVMLLAKFVFYGMNRLVEKFPKLLTWALFLADCFFLAVLFLNTISGILITGNFRGDLIFWLFLFAGSIWAIFGTLPESQDKLKIRFILKLTAGVMMLVYYTFQKDMGRYVLLVLPYFYIITAIELESLLALFRAKGRGLNKKLRQYLEFSLFAILCLLFSVQVYYILSFPKYRVPDYHSEVSAAALKVIDQNEASICKSDVYDCGTIKPVLYVAQQDPFFWADFENKYEIRFLSKENYAEVVKNVTESKQDGQERATLSLPVNIFAQHRVYFFEDPSLTYKDAYFVPNARFISLNGVTKTNAQFWVNDSKSDGWYKIWYANW